MFFRNTSLSILETFNKCFSANMVNDVYCLAQFTPNSPTVQLEKRLSSSSYCGLFIFDFPDSGCLAIAYGRFQHRHTTHIRFSIFQLKRFGLLWFVGSYTTAIHIHNGTEMEKLKRTQTGNWKTNYAVGDSLVQCAVWREEFLEHIVWL